MKNKSKQDAWIRCLARLQGIRNIYDVPSDYTNGYIRGLDRGIEVIKEHMPKKKKSK